jgi:hypothetical protein
MPLWSTADKPSGCSVADLANGGYIWLRRIATLRRLPGERSLLLSLCFVLVAAVALCLSAGIATSVTAGAASLLRSFVIFACAAEERLRRLRTED